MKTAAAPCEATLAATVAGEDLCVGMFVAVLSEIEEYPSFLWDAAGVSLAPQDVVRLTCIPRDAGVPLKVKAICLPFVFVRHPAGNCQTLDIRRMQLVRLDEKYAKQVCKEQQRKTANLVG